MALQSLANQAGIPTGVLQLVTASKETAPEVGHEFCTNPLVQKISFTGSTAVGKKLMKLSSDTVKRLSLELGGNAPFVVFEDADLDQAVESAIASKFRNAGQTCVCADRFLVHASVHDTFVKKLAKRVRDIKVGQGMDESTTMGPLISSDAVMNIAAKVKEAVKEGANCVVGGSALKDLGTRRGGASQPGSIPHGRSATVSRGRVFSSSTAGAQQQTTVPGGRVSSASTTGAQQQSTAPGGRVSSASSAGTQQQVPSRRSPFEGDFWPGGTRSGRRSAPPDEFLPGALSAETQQQAANRWFPTEAASSPAGNPSGRPTTPPDEFLPGSLHAFTIGSQQQTTSGDFAPRDASAPGGTPPDEIFPGRSTAEAEDTTPPDEIFPYRSTAEAQEETTDQPPRTPSHSTPQDDPVASADREEAGHKSHFFEPTILTNVSPNSRIWKTETFGPVAAIVKFRTEEEALRLANDSSVGLASYFCTQNLSRAFRFAQR